MNKYTKTPIIYVKFAHKSSSNHVYYPANIDFAQNASSKNTNTRAHPKNFTSNAPTARRSTNTIALTPCQIIKNIFHCLT